MVSEIFPVAALEQYAERKFRHPAPCTSVHSPSMINTRQLPASSTIVKYTLHSLGDLFKERHKIIHTTIS